MQIDYTKLGKEYRRDIVEVLAACGRGHVGAAFSIIEIMSVLFEKILKFDPKNPLLPERDRLILSKGHACLALYVVLARKGYFSREELFRFCKPDGILGGHPDHRKVPGVETSTGSLGHGMSVGIGMALAARLDGIPARVFVILGDGECNEGSIWEAAMSAAKHKLGNLIVLIDYNKMQSYGFVKDILDLEPFTQKWQSFGFDTKEIDMDYPQKLEDLLLSLPNPSPRPVAIICHTVKGKGVSFVENNPNWHHKAKLTDEETKLLMDALRTN